MGNCWRISWRCCCFYILKVYMIQFIFFYFNIIYLIYFAFSLTFFCSFHFVRMVTLVMISLKWLSRQASVGWAIMARAALSYSSYLSYRNTSSAHRCACSAARNTCPHTIHQLNKLGILYKANKKGKKYQYLSRMNHTIVRISTKN